MTDGTKNILTEKDALSMGKHALLIRADQWGGAANIDCVDLEEMWVSSTEEAQENADLTRQAHEILTSTRAKSGNGLPADEFGLIIEALEIVANQWQEVADTNDVALAEIWEAGTEERRSMESLYRNAYIVLEGYP